MGASMRHRNKVVIIAAMVVGLALIVLFWNWSAPYEVSKKIWLPQNHSIVNLMQGKHIKEIIRVVPSGTLLWLDFDDYKKQLADVKGTVVVGNGEVYYFVKTDEGVTFASEVSYRNPWRGGCLLSIAKDGTIQVGRERNIIAFGLYSFLAILALVILGNVFSRMERRCMRG